MNKEERLQLLLEACQYGYSLDELEALTRDLDAHALAICCGNVSVLPKYKKSKGTP